VKSIKVTVINSDEQKKVVSFLRRRVTPQNWQTVNTKKVVSFFQKK